MSEEEYIWIHLWCGFTLLEKSSLVRVFAVRDVLVRARGGGNGWDELPAKTVQG